MYLRRSQHEGNGSLKFVFIRELFIYDKTLYLYKHQLTTNGTYSLVSMYHYYIVKIYRLYSLSFMNSSTFSVVHPALGTQQQAVLASSLTNICLSSIPSSESGSLAVFSFRLSQCVQNLSTCACWNCNQGLIVKSIIPYTFFALSSISMVEL